MSSNLILLVRSTILLLTFVMPVYAEVANIGDASNEELTENNSTASSESSDQGNPVNQAQLSAVKPVVEVDQESNLKEIGLLENSVESEFSWPEELANSDLPMAGIFYGNELAGRGTANARVSLESSRRFRAEKTGDIVSYTYHNRLLRQGEIEARCKASQPDSVWCRCKSAGLDANLCGYTLPNSYHVGNGGTVVVELREDDGGGYPSDVVLGKTEAFIPVNHRDKWFAKLNFVSPAPVQAGRIYHLVHTNLTPPTRCRIRNVPVSEAAGCSRNEGAQGLNGSFYSSYPSTTGRWGPYRGDVGAATMFRQRNGDWQISENSVSFYEVGYSDGVSVGDAYHSYDAIRTQRVIGGSVKARQVFTVSQISRNVDGVWLSHGHRRGASGSALQIELKDENGEVLSTGEIDASEYCLSLLSNDAPSPGKDCRDWSYTPLTPSVNLLEGHDYSLELSGSSGSRFVVSTYQTLDSFGMEDRKQWRNARAEISEDSGGRWREWTTQGGLERDMAVLFTIVGMPRQLR